MFRQYHAKSPKRVLGWWEWFFHHLRLFLLVIIEACLYWGVELIPSFGFKGWLLLDDHYLLLVGVLQIYRNLLLLFVSRGLLLKADRGGPSYRRPGAADRVVPTQFLKLNWWSFVEPCERLMGGRVKILLRTKLLKVSIELVMLFELRNVALSVLIVCQLILFKLRLRGVQILIPFLMLNRFF